MLKATPLGPARLFFALPSLIVAGFASIVFITGQYAVHAASQVNNRAYSPPQGRLLVAYATYTRSVAPDDGGRDTGDVPQGQILNSTGSSHIYLINLPSQSRTQLTFGPSYDTSPMWLPDGKSCVFLRYSIGQGPDILYVLNVLHNTLHRWISLPKGCDASECRLHELQDGRLVISDVYADKPATYLIDLSGKVRRLANIDDYVPSPTGQLRALVRNHQSNYAPISVTSAPNGPVISGTALGIAWISENNLIVAHYQSFHFKALAFDRWSANGRRISTTIVKLPTVNFFDAPDPSFGRIEMHLIDNDNLVFETNNLSDDGMRAWVCVVNLSHPRWTPLHKGNLLGISPDHRWVAIAQHNWVGAYKRGGQRLGPILLASVDRQHIQKVTPLLIDGEDGDWR